MNSRATRDVVLQTPHLERATAFYRDTMELRVFLQTPDLVGLDAGAFHLFLDRAGSLGPVMEFLVDDVAAARRKLLDEGCTVLAEDNEMGHLYLRDPFGLIFNVALDPHGAQEEPEQIRDAEPPPHY